MKTNKRNYKCFDEMVNRILFIKGWKRNGEPCQSWLVLPPEPTTLKASRRSKRKKMKLKLNDAMQPLNKLKLKLNDAIRLPMLGDLVTHSEHPLGIGLVVERHPVQRAFRVQWLDNPNLNLFIDERVLLPIDKEHAHENDSF